MAYTHVHIAADGLSILTNPAKDRVQLGDGTTDLCFPECGLSSFAGNILVDTTLVSNVAPHLWQKVESQICDGVSLECATYEVGYELLGYPDMWVAVNRIIPTEPPCDCDAFVSIAVKLCGDSPMGLYTHVSGNPGWAPVVTVA